MRISLVALALLLPSVSALQAATFQLTEATIADMEKAMDQGGVTSVELCALYLNRILAYDRGRGGLKAVSQLSPTAFADAEAADRRRALGQATGSLEGIPFLVKDCFDVAGLASASGSRAMKHVFATTDGPVVGALKGAGGVLLGKANMWPFAYGTGFDPNSRYAWGRVRSPYTHESDFDGSSTGSAAATAANFCAFALGGDTGSSIRLPCARTALVGGRPSLFLLPTSGIIPTNATLDVIGPMTRTVADYARVMNVVVFDDPAPLDTHFFPPSSKVRPRDYAARLDGNALRGKVIGLPKPYIGKAKPLDPSVQANWTAAVATLERAGATVKEIDWPFYENSMAGTEASRTHGYASVGLTTTQFKDMWQWCDAYYFNEHIKSYHDAKIRSVLDLPVPTARQDPDNVDKIRGFQRYVCQGLAKSYTAYHMRDYFAAFRRWAKRDVENVMAAAGVDLLAFPTSGRENPDQPQYEYLNAVLEGSLLGLPQISVPMGFSPVGRPQGMMLMARTYYTEDEILGYAHAFERLSQARRPPAGTPPLRGEKITYAPHSVTGRPEVDPPQITVQPFIYRHSARARYTFSGTATDASGIASVDIYLNGRRVGGASGAAWTAYLSKERFARLTRDYQRRDRPMVVVVARDIHGNTSALAARMQAQ